MNPYRRWIALKDRIGRLAQGQKGLWGLMIAAFLESSFVPLPLELFLIPSFMAQPRRAWALASAALAGCLAAAALFYFLGWLAYRELGRDIAALLGLTRDITAFGTQLRENGFWLIAFISFFPLPIQIATLGSGAFGYPFLPFMASIAMSRLARFHGLALLTWLLGPRLERLFKSVSPFWQWTFTLLSLLALIGFAWLSFHIAAP